MLTNDTTSTKIQPIETKYKGYRFRSRLEARWAVFFDALKIKWEYEPEGYDLGQFGCYLPDFYIWGFGFAEVKPEGFEIDNEKYTRVVKLTGESIMLLLGPPNAKYYPCYITSFSGVVDEHSVIYNPVKHGGTWWYAFGYTGDAEDTLGERGLSAINASRSKRFEFGE